MTRDETGFEALLESLRQERGCDLTGYKRATLARRIGRRMQAVQADGYGAYQDYLQAHPQELPRLLDSILIQVSSFFRDAPAWEHLRSEVVPRICAGKTEAEPIRVWSAGCARGQEAFSLAMVLAEALGEEGFRSRVKLYATDLDEDALRQARQGRFGARELQGVPEALRERYFEPAQDGPVFRRELGRGIVFGRHDLARDAPISRLDLLLCRNTLMYFNAQAQAQILSRLHFGLGEQGYLFLGNAEMLPAQSSLFAPVAPVHRIFRKLPKAPPAGRNPATPPPLDDAGAGLPPVVREQLQTLRAELQATAQELDATREELQSTNEELETMNGELQSTHREVAATNDRLRRTDELFQGVFDGLGPALVVLDRELKVQVWNRQAEALWRLSLREAQGRPLLALETGLPRERLRPALRDCLQGRGEPVEIEASDPQGRVHRCRIVCVPAPGGVGLPLGVLLTAESGSAD